MAKKKNVAFLVILIVSLLFLASCDVLEKRLAQGTSVAGGDSGGGAGDLASETPTPEDIGIGDTGGGEDEDEDDDDDDDGLEGPGAIGTAIQQTLDAWDTVTAQAASPDLITLSATTEITITPTSGTQEPTSTVPGWQYTALYNTITAVYGSTETAAVVSSTPTPEDTPLPGEPTKPPSSTPEPCYVFRFVAHPNYPPGTVVSPSTSFYKSWYIQNVGSCVWSPGFALVYDGGFQLGGASPTLLGATVHPGQYVTLTMNFYTPPQPGTYRGTWLLQTTGGSTFGGGESQDEPLVVEVYVPGVMPPVSTSPASTAPPFTPGP